MLMGSCPAEKWDGIPFILSQIILDVKAVFYCLLILSLGACDYMIVPFHSCKGKEGTEGTNGTNGTDGKHLSCSRHNSFRDVPSVLVVPLRFRCFCGSGYPVERNSVVSVSKNINLFSFVERETGWCMSSILTLFLRIGK